MKKLRKTMFPNDVFLKIEKKDGIISLIYFSFLIMYSFLALYLIKNSSLFFLVRNGTSFIYPFIFMIIMDVPPFIVMLVILKFRKQTIYTIGLKKRGLKSSLVLGCILLSFFIVYYIRNHGISLRIVYYSIYYFIFIGTYEEILSRGFLWSRLVVGFGKKVGTVLSGILFGIMHIPFDIIINNKTVFSAFIIGNTSSSNIASGIIGAIIYIYIYTRNENILLPSFIHGFIDILSI